MAHIYFYIHRYELNRKLDLCRNWYNHLFTKKCTHVVDYDIILLLSTIRLLFRMMYVNTHRSKFPSQTNLRQYHPVPSNKHPAPKIQKEEESCQQPSQESPWIHTLRNMKFVYDDALWCTTPYSVGSMTHEEMHNSLSYPCGSVPKRIDTIVQSGYAKKLALSLL